MHASLTLIAAETPADDDVVAGWIGLIVFVGLVIAVALLAVSLTKQLRKAARAKQEGVYGPVEEDAPDSTGSTHGADNGADNADNGSGA